MGKTHVVFHAEGTVVRGVLRLAWGAVAGAGGHSKPPASGHAKVLGSW